MPRRESLQMSHVKRREAQRKILTWYKKNGRHDLPWRKNTTPYRVLVSEVMLQQTQVGRVIQMYNTFMKRFPSWRKLAQEKTPELLRAWQGLGYNRRALMLRECARVVVNDYGGRLPRAYDELVKLPGIGPYTAHAVNIFARNYDEVCVDTNVRRVLTHELGLKKTLSDKQLEEIALQLLPHGRSREWHSALMDYGSAVATSRKTGVTPRVKQSTFKHSDRYYRGQILKQLLAKKKIEMQELEKSLKITRTRLTKIIVGLKKDGMVVVRENHLALAK